MQFILGMNTTCRFFLVLTILAASESFASSSSVALMDPSQMHFAPFDAPRESTPSARLDLEAPIPRSSSARLLTSGLVLATLGGVGVLGGVMIAGTPHHSSGWLDWNLNPLWGGMLGVLAGSVVILGLVLTVIAIVQLATAHDEPQAWTLKREEQRFEVPVPKAPPAPTALVQVAKF